jgi:hypothetical protein
LANQPLDPSKGQEYKIHDRPEDAVVDCVTDDGSRDSKKPIAEEIEEWVRFVVCHSVP